MKEILKSTGIAAAVCFGIAAVGGTIYLLVNAPGWLWGEYASAVSSGALIFACVVALVYVARN